MKTRISTITALLALATSFSAFAQHAIHGTIKDSGGSPLPGVKVYITDTYYGVYSNSEGKYQFSEVNDGKY